jgi:arachidonate 15-lipoxygenase
VKPCLPSADPNPEARSVALAKSREVYRYSYAWPAGVAVAAEVPKADEYSPEYMAQGLVIVGDIFRNLLPCANLFVHPEGVHELLADQLELLRRYGPRNMKSDFLTVQTVVAAHMTERQPASLEDFGRFFNSIKAPPVWSHWDDDRAFAWQRIAGVNPMHMRRVSSLPEDVAIGEAHFARAVPGGSLAAALAEGRVFACDYTLLARVPPGTTHGRRKWLPAPYALFVAEGGALRPVAIQAGAVRTSPVFTPADGHDWRIARLAVNTADASFHEVVYHLGRTHMVMEAVSLATRRQLAPEHPIAVLLAPHLEFTLAINNSAATNLIAPKGAIDLMFGATIEASAGLVKPGMDGFSLSHGSPAADIAARGLDDRAVLPEHPYRDDALPVWSAIHRFAASYVQRYYPTDAEVAGDPELAAWIGEMGAADGGRLQGLEPVTSASALADLLATVIWTGSAQHAAVNFPQFPYMGVMPNILGAFWAEWPVPGRPSDEGTYLSLMPPYNMAALQHGTVYQLSSLRMNRLGHYPFLHFKDKAVRALVERFNADLQEAEKVIAARDQGRFLPYPFLLPSNIPASIHI